MHDFDRSNLLSIALSYVTDEMSTERRAEFEMQLAEDQSSREAVARAVRIAEGVRFVESSSPHSPQSHVIRMQRTMPARFRIWPAAIAASACLAVAFVLQFSPNSRMGTTGGPEISVSIGNLNSQIVEAEHLVDVWSQSEGAVAGLDDALFAGNFDDDDQQQPAGDEFENSDDFENSNGFETIAGVENGEETRLVVPDWMLAAVSSSLDLEKFDAFPADSQRPSQEN